jgi:chromosome partitioning protein
MVMTPQQTYFTLSDLTAWADSNKTTVYRYLVSKNLVPASTGAEEKRKKYSFEVARAFLGEFVAKKLKPVDKIQVFYNFKGGTGKTSICHQISVMFALYGYKVLVIDCDPQAHLSQSLGFEATQDFPTLFDVIVNKKPISETIHHNVYPGLDVIPSNLSLTMLELQLNQMTNREKVIYNHLKTLKDKYDFIFIDTNPTISTLNRGVTYAADCTNIVCETQPFSLKGLEIVVRELDSFAVAMEKTMKYCIIPNKYEFKTATSQESLGLLIEKYKEFVLQSVVRKCEDFNISAKSRLPVFVIGNKRSIAIEDIRDLAKELLKKSTKNVTGELFDAA